MGQKVIVFSDHKPLEGLTLKAHPDEELGDMVNFILQFNVTVRYKPGLSNLEADSLSRSPVLDHSENNFSDCIKVANHVCLQDIILDQKKLPPSSSHIIKNNIIYCKRRNQQKILLTEDFGKALARSTHEKFGHIGSRHLANILCPHYQFRNMRSFLDSICSSCDTCIRNKTRTTSNFGLLGH